MKIETTVSDLRKAMKSATPLIEKRSAIPVLSTGKLTADKRITLCATNMDMWAEFQVDGQIHDKGEVLLPVGSVFGVIKEADADGKVVLETTDEHSLSVSVSWAGMHVNWTTDTLPPEDFPSVHPSQERFAFNLDPDSLRELFSKVSFAISTEETRYYLNGVHLCLEDGRLTSVATDGHRLAKYRRSLGHDFFDPKKFAGVTSGVIVPRTAVAMILANTPKAGSNQPIRCKLNSNAEGADPQLFVVEFGDYIKISARLIDGTFPDYTRVVPKFSDMQKLDMDRQRLSKVIKALSGISANSKQPSIRFDVDGATLDLKHDSCMTGMPGSAHSRMTVAWRGKPKSFGLNGRYCTDMLRQFEGDSITFCMENGPEGEAYGYHCSPIVVMQPDDQDFICVQMPMRV